VSPQDLLGFRQALSIVHHVAGRIRLRVGPALLSRLAAVNGESVQGLLRSLGGIRGIRVNAAAATVIIEYDPQRLAPGMWETLLEGGDAEAAALLSRLLHQYAAVHEAGLTS
jgi:hypothetical protein